MKIGNRKFGLTTWTRGITVYVWPFAINAFWKNEDIVAFWKNKLDFLGVPQTGIYVLWIKGVVEGVPCRAIGYKFRNASEQQQVLR